MKHKQVSSHCQLSLALSLLTLLLFLLIFPFLPDGRGDKYSISYHKIQELGEMMPNCPATRQKKKEEEKKTLSTRKITQQKYSIQQCINVIRLERKKKYLKSAARDITFMLIRFLLTTYFNVNLWIIISNATGSQKVIQNGENSQSNKSWEKCPEEHTIYIIWGWKELQVTKWCNYYPCKKR